MYSLFGCLFCGNFQFLFFFVFACFDSKKKKRLKVVNYYVLCVQNKTKELPKLGTNFTSQTFSNQQSFQFPCVANQKKPCKSFRFGSFTLQQAPTFENLKFSTKFMIF